MTIRKSLSSLALALLFSAQLAHADTPRKDWSFREVGRIPVQGGGRVKPLDSFAREAVLLLTGSRSFQGWDPVNLLFSWLSVPGDWDDREFIQLSRKDVRRQLGLSETQARFAPKQLFQNATLLQYAQKMSEPVKGVKEDARQQELRHLFERLAVFRSLVSAEGWLVVPRPSELPWGALGVPEQTGTQLKNDEAGARVRSRFVALVRAYRSEDHAAFDTAALEAREEVERAVPGWSPSMDRTIRAEVLYNRVHPFQWAWIFYLSSAILLTVGTAVSKKRAVIWTRLGGGALALAVAAHVFGFALRCYVAGRPPVTNMYESIIWVSLGIIFFAGILYAVHRQSVILIVAATLATLGLIAGDASPAMMDPGIHPLVPVLRSNYWLTIHVLTITLGYAAFALTLGLANVTLFHFLRKSPAQKITALNQFTYRAMQFGVVLLAAGTILGGIWADYSWGRFWGWDPKEVWALIALLSYLAILHGRFTGWVGQFGYAAWTVFAFLSVVMAWYGVNFVLGVGLHSYGFSTGGRGWVASFVVAQLAYVAYVAIQRKKSR